MVRKCFISNKWRSPKVIIALFVLEFAFTVPALALFAVADPNTYRDKLREDGYLNGFNSNPAAALYAAANYQPYSAPLVWSQFLTSYNVVIAVLSTFLLLIKAVMFILHIWWPPLSFIIHGILTALWAFSTWGQSSPDMSDPTHPQAGSPWYITRSCSIAHYQSNIKYCTQAKAVFIITCILTALFGLNSAWAIWSMVPTKKQRIARQRRYNDEVDSEYEDDSDSDDEDEPREKRGGAMEMQQMAGASGSQSRGGVFGALKSPRTTTFNHLTGGR